MLRLSDSCALFFVLLWNFCDDEGKHRLDYDQIKAELGGRWDKGKLKLFTTQLIKSGQLSISCDSGWLRVNNWFHQKIDKPRRPEMKVEDIQWLAKGDSTKGIESSSKSRRKDRIGSDTIGSDRIVTATPEPSPPEEIPVTRPLWKKYEEAYEGRYGTRPLWNPKNGGILKNVLKRIPADEAPDVLAFYLGHNNAYYVREAHSLDAFVKDCEKLRMEWVTGRKITQTEARQVDRRQANLGVFEKLIAEAEAKEAAKCRARTF